MTRLQGRPITIGRDATGRPVTLTPEDREAHAHVMGLPGSGKTKFLEMMIREDIKNRNGVCLLDPAGNLFNDLVRWITDEGFLDPGPKHRNIILFDPTRRGWSVAFNPLEFHVADDEDTAAAVDAVMLALSSARNVEALDDKPRLVRIARATIAAAAEKNVTLNEALHMLSAYDPYRLRAYLTSGIKNPVMAAEWSELNAVPERDLATLFESARNRFLGVLSSTAMRLMFSQQRATINFKKLMDEGYTVLVNLHADDTSFSAMDAAVLGRLIVSNICRSARQRLRAHQREPRPFYLVIDECHQYLNDDIARGIAELRQFGLRFVLSHQYLGQLENVGPVITGAVKGAAQLKVYFQLSDDDADGVVNQMFRGTINLQEAKEVLSKMGVVGYRKEILRSSGRSTSTGWGSSTGRSSGTSRGATTSVGSSRARSSGRSTSSSIDAYGVIGDPESETLSDSESSVDGLANGLSDSSSESSSESESTSGSEAEHEGWSETLVPILERQAGATYSLEEQRFRKGTLLTSQGRGQAFIKLKGRDAFACAISPVKPAVASDRRVEREKELAMRVCPFVKPSSEVQQELEDREMELKQLAAAIPDDDPAPESW